MSKKYQTIFFSVLSNGEWVGKLNVVVGGMANTVGHHDQSIDKERDDRDAFSLHG